jgi:MraZ protein
MKASPLFGSVEKRIDAKGRLSIPKSFREYLRFSDDQELYIVMIDGVLTVFTPHYFDVFNRQVQSKSLLSKKARELQRLWGLRVSPLSWDTAGRIKLTPQQKRYAGIQHNVVLVGSSNRMEIWSQERHDVTKVLNDQYFDELSQELDSLA